MEHAPLPSVYYGPDRIPLTQGDWALPEQAGSLFFGIAPLSWVTHRWGSPEAAARIWHDRAAELDTALRNPDETDETLVTSVSVLKQAKALSFRASGDAAIDVARRFAREFGPSDATVSSVWCIKEGHVSSVWYTRLALSDGRFRSVAINVARDAVAADRLRQSAQVLRACAAGPVAQVRAVYDDRGAFALVQDWVPEAREIGVWRKPGKAVGLVAIERFLHDPEAPARVHGVVAERLTAKHWKALTSVVAKMHRISTTGIEVPRFALEHGDFVATPKGLRMVACDGSWQVLPGLPPGASKGAIERAVATQLKDATRVCVAYQTAN